MKNKKNETETKGSTNCLSKFFCRKDDEKNKEQIKVDTFTIDFEPIITQTQIDFLHKAMSTTDELNGK